MVKDLKLKMFLAGGTFVLLGLLLFNSFFVFGIGSRLDDKVAEAKELAKPAKVELITLISSCSDCFDIESVRTTLKEADSLEITNEQSLSGDSGEARKLIAQYEITKLPTIIVKGEIDKASIQNFIKTDDALLFQGHSPPYVDAVTQEVKGKVNTVVINEKNCDECGDLSLFVQNVKQSGVVLAGQEILDASDGEAKEWITKLGITKLPALLISDDIDAYPISDKMKQSGLNAKDGYYIIESSAPYVEVATGNVRGLVTLTMVDDELCEECYDVNLHRQIFAQMGLVIKDTKTVDINSAEGVQLRVKYTLKKVPTIILTGDLEAYEGFAEQVWQQVGTVENDKAYVFRNVELLGRGIQYKDLTTGKVTGLA